DALQAVIGLMEAPAAGLIHRNAFNVAAMSVTPAEITTAIQRHLPNFTVDYEVDPMRQAIADSWPQSLNDQAAREEWGWSPQWTLATMTEDMLNRLSARQRGAHHAD